MRAVAFIIFDRPELTKRLFEKIRSAKSAILLVVPDSGFLLRCCSWPDIRQIPLRRTPVDRPQSAGRYLEVGQGSPAQRSLIVALAAASYVIESAGGAILAMTDGVASRSRGNVRNH